MPLYDRQCVCGWSEIDRWEPVAAPVLACPMCGGETQRAWLTKASTVIGDEIDFVQHNGTRTPIRFRSRGKFKRWLKANDYRVKDSHIGAPGSDKSKHTTNWGAQYDPYTAANVQLLLERAFKAGTTRDEDLAPLSVGVTCGEVGDDKWKAFHERR